MSNTTIMDSNIKSAYEYANTHCQYGRSDLSYPPGDTGYIDCVGLVYRALYTMGFFHKMENINRVITLCEDAGMVKSNNITDVYKYHGVVCMQDKNNIGTQHVNHVFYSLGGSSINDISKYDLGSEKRIRSNQPFQHIPVNEWSDKEFMCFLYYPITFENKFTGNPIFEATTIVNANMRVLGGKSNSLLCVIPKGIKVPVLSCVSTTKTSRWFYIKYNNKYGFVHKNSLSYQYKIPNNIKRVSTPDNSLNCRVGAGTEYDVFSKVKSLSNGTKVRVLNSLIARDLSIWYNVLVDGYFFFVSAMWIQ